MFRENIRAYNSIFAFTSIGGNIDHRVNNGTGPYVYCISGQNHHKIGSLLLVDGITPKFAQLYIYDTINKVPNRMRTLSGDNRSSRLDSNIVSELLHMLDEHNGLAKMFRMARDRFQDMNFAPVRLRLIATQTKDPTMYNLPSAFKVAALIVRDLNNTNFTRDIVIEHKSSGLQRINEIHPSFMAMQYPVLFPYGEDGFQIGIRYTINEGRRQTLRSRVTMREYYAYRIQQRRDESKTMLCSGRL